MSKNPYQDTLARMEPDIAMVDLPAAAASIAVSLKRIADAHEKLVELQEANLAMLRESVATTRFVAGLTPYGEGF